MKKRGTSDNMESKEFVQKSVLTFIYEKCREAAIFFCNPTDSDIENNSIMNNAEFYKRNPEVFDLQNRIMQNERNFITFTDREMAIWFGLEPTRKNIKIVLSIDNALPHLISLNKKMIERVKLILTRQALNSEDCVHETYQQLKKGWGQESSRISDIYNEGDGLTPEFYDEIYNKIIYPKIQSRLKIYSKMKNIPYIFLPYHPLNRSIQEDFEITFPGLNKSDSSVPEDFEITFPGKDATGKKRKKTIRKRKQITTRKHNLKGKRKQTIRK